MSEVITISSSDDEVVLPKASQRTHDNTSSKEALKKKRKFPFEPAGEGSSAKKLKFEDSEKTSKVCIDSNLEKTSSSLNSCLSIDNKSENHRVDNNCNLIMDSKPSEAGTLKYFDEVEKQLQTKSPSNTGVRDKTVRRIQPVLIVKDIIPNSADKVFEDFLKACANYEKADEETKVILEKLQKKYNKLDSFNKHDRDFILFLRNRVNNITHKKAKFYQTIFEVREEISRRIIKLKKDKSTREKGSESDTEPEYTTDELKKIKILEKVIKECQRRIEELETAEVIFDDDEDSAYLKEDRYKRKYVQLCQALSDIARDKKLKSEIMKKKITLNDIQDEMTGIKAIDQSIIDFVNISISRMNKLKHIQNFNADPNYIVPPDFYEVLQIIEKHTETRNLQFSKQEIELYATKSFKAVVKYLKNCRLQEFKEYIGCFISDTCGKYIDPASNDENLEKILQANKLNSDKHLNEVFEKYVNMQKNLSNEKLKESMTAMYSSEESCNLDNHEKHLVAKNSQVGKRKRFLHSDEEESGKDNQTHNSREDEEKPAKKMKKNDDSKCQNTAYENNTKEKEIECIDVGDNCTSPDSPTRDVRTLVDDNSKYFPRIRVASVGNFPKAWETSDSPESPGKESIDLDFSPKKNIFPPVEVVDLCSPERRSKISSITVSKVPNPLAVKKSKLKKKLIFEITIDD